MKKITSMEAFGARFEEVSAKLGPERRESLDYWVRTSKRGLNFFLGADDEFWQIVFAEFPRLLAAAREFGRPETFRCNRPLWSAFEYIGDVLGECLDEAVKEFRRYIMNDEWRKEIEAQHDAIGRLEKQVLAFRRHQEFEKMINSLGIAEYKPALTDHGMTAAEFKQLEKIVKETEKQIEIAKAPPPPKESLFDAPKKGKYPTFDDIEYAQYLADLWSKYGKSLDQLRSYGMPLDSSQFEEMEKKLQDLDFAETCATLGAQKRRPPEDDHGSNARTYELFATLPATIAAKFESSTLAEVESTLKTNLEFMRSNMSSMRSIGFTALRDMKKVLTWLVAKFPMPECEALATAEAMIAREYEPLWAAMSAGAVHEKNMGKICFSNSPTLPPGDADWPDTLNPAKDAVYGHVFLDQAIGNLGTMYFVKMGDQWLQASKKVMKNPDSAYQVLQLFPDSEVGRDPALVQAFGAALEAAAADGELLVEFSPDTKMAASGKLMFKMSKADAGKIKARSQELATAAEANLTKEAILPEAFTKPFKGYKDKVLAKEKLIAAIEEAWERTRGGQKISVKALCLNHYRGPGHEWDEERRFEQPTARLTFSYAGMVFESDGKMYCVPDGIQFRQFYLRGKGYGDELNVLFWGCTPFGLPPEQVKRIAK